MNAVVINYMNTVVTNNHNTTQSIGIGYWYWHQYFCDSVLVLVIAILCVLILVLVFAIEFIGIVNNLANNYSTVNTGLELLTHNYRIVNT